MCPYGAGSFLSSMRADDSEASMVKTRTPASVSWAQSIDYMLRHHVSSNPKRSVICIQPQVIQRHGIYLLCCVAGTQEKTQDCRSTGGTSLILRMISRASLTSRLPFSKPRLGQSCLKFRARLSPHYSACTFSDEPHSSLSKLTLSSSSTAGCVVSALCSWRLCPMLGLGDNWQRPLQVIGLTQEASAHSLTIEKKTRLDSLTARWQQEAPSLG